MQPFSTQYVFSFMVGARSSMSKLLVECPSCGQKVTSGRFCKSCGRPLLGEPEQEQARSSVTQSMDFRPNKGVSEVGPKSEEMGIPSYGVSVDGVDSKVLSALLAQVELSVIRNELDHLINQIEATRKAVLLEHADKDVLASRAESLKEAFEKTKSRRALLIGAKGSLSIEAISAELAVQQSKLSKLERMSRSIDSDVYREEHDKIAQAVEGLRQDLKGATDESRAWIKALDSRIRALKREASRLEARFKIGDISARLYEESRLDVDRSIRILEGGQELLRSKLAAVQRK